MCGTPGEPGLYPAVPGVPDDATGSESHSVSQYKWCPLPPWD